jgi:hypothetical protein
MATYPTDRVVLVIVAVLKPYLGGVMAASAVEMHRQKLNLNGSQISRNQVQALIDSMGAGLNVFVGHDKAAQVMEQMQVAVKGEAK